MINIRMEKTGVKLKCDKHGEYDQIKRIVGGSEFMIDNCPMCEKESDLKQAQIDSEKESKEQYELTIKQRLASGVSKRNVNKSFEDFICDAGSEEQRAKDKFVRSLLKLNKKEDISSMIVTGGVGTGKTLLASCFINGLGKFRYGKLVKLIDMMRDVKNSWKPGASASETEVIEKYASLDILILDEIGVSFNSEAEKIVLFDIIDGRYQNMLPTFILTNLDVDALKNVLGERIVDRLREDGGLLIELSGKSKRVGK